MARHIKLTIESPISDERYADLANTIWMMLRNTPHEFIVEPDGKTSVDILNRSWNTYGEEACWE